MVGEVRPGPLQDHQDAVAEADEEEDVDGQPGGPGNEAAEFDAPEIGDSRGAADRGERSFVAVAEGEGGRAFENACSSIDALAERIFRKIRAASSDR